LGVSLAVPTRGRMGHNGSGMPSKSLSKLTKREKEVVL